MVIQRALKGIGLFAGGSGTDKTLAAEVIANELRLNLYRIELSQVVCKYIGETAKNLGRIFEAAEASGSILLFDEAFLPRMGDLGGGVAIAGGRPGRRRGGEATRKEATA